MRRRFQVSLYTEHDIEAELIDFLISHDPRKRQELLRTLLKAGFSAMIKHKSSSQAMLDTIESDTIALVLQSLIKSNGIQNITGQQGEYSHHHNSNSELPKKTFDSTRTIKPKVTLNPNENKESLVTDGSNENKKLKPDTPKSLSEKELEQFTSDDNDDGLLDVDPAIYMSENHTEEWDDELLIDDLDDIEDPLAQLMSKMN